MHYPNPNQHNNDNTGLGRILLIIAISIGFFALYSYLFPQKPQTQAPANTSAPKDLTANALSDPQTPNASALNANNTNAQGTLDPTQSTPLRSSLIATFGNESFEVEIDALGRIAQVYLKDKKFTHDEQESLFSILGKLIGLKSSQKAHIDKLPLFGDIELKPLELRFSDQELDKKTLNTPYILQSNTTLEDGSQALVFTQNLGEVQVTKKLTFHPNLTYNIEINLSNPNLSYFLSNGMRPSGDNDTYAFRGVLLKTSEGTIEKIEDKDSKKRLDFAQSLFVASVDRYYTSLLFPKEGSFYVRLNGDYAGNPQPFVYIKGGSAQFDGYIGPKDHKTLNAINPVLTDVIEYGIITFFARPVFWLLSYLHDFCGNWGWAIVLLTLVVRILLFPLTFKGMVSMQKLKDIAPKMKEIQTRYKGDPQKMQMHMMELYKKHGANPLGGCLPLLLQIPVFFAIYRVLYNAIELKNSEWILWIDDLSAIDPYFVLPVLMGLSMYVSQRLTPSNFNDPMQEKIFKMLPWFFMVFFIIFPFPAGLVLYWTINNIFSILQQLFINSLLKRKKEQEIAAHEKQKITKHEKK
ncbi:membrane protein insertase YidC [Helicobacter sp. MIT 00-7814]|uniref:membrane protein insertase YidC n=1 Tax=unclassified Helicobacter TaxID=2593540 RepID=UPI000E1E825F|nr:MULTISPECIES: membrane protein insertase YidC [unclassified Helicobacter]RDU53687.1 membrane protein insertase YidC [Helicobacter sp. MIT 99-10781]RDU54073.1 membrane protein insertase YidC [Helicobacter sp. MIT 00-7814]